VLYLNNLLVLKNPILEACTFTLTSGECSCLSGLSGSGKTLLLRAIAELDEYRGEMFLQQIECQQYSAPEWRKQIGFLTAETYWWHNTVGSHFTNQQTSQLSEWLAQLGLDKSILSADVNYCSTGEKQRLALLRLLQNHPKVILLDEPTSSMDAETAIRVETFIEAYRQQHHSAVFWVSHNPEQIKRIADKHLKIQNGQLIEVPVS